MKHRVVSLPPSKIFQLALASLCHIVVVSQSEMHCKRFFFILHVSLATSGTFANI